MPRPKKAAPTSTAAVDEPMFDIPADPEPSQPRSRRAPASRAATGRPAGRPRTKAGPRASNGRVMSAVAMRAKVEGELYGLMVLASSVFSAKDPCAEIPFEVNRQGVTHAEAMASAYTALLARNDKALAFVASSGIMGDVLTAILATAPVVMGIMRAHGPGGTGHGDQEDQIDANRYPAYTG